jgi:hypothetical protein
MIKTLRTAFFVHKPTQKVIYRLSMKTGFKYLWEKEKVMTLERLAKDKFINKAEIEVRDQGSHLA